MSTKKAVDSMLATLQSVENQLLSGRLAAEPLADFKSAVDDLRLRLWAVMSSANMEDPQAALHRFRLRRALEITRAVTTDLASSTMRMDHRELSELESASAELLGTIARRRSGAA